MHYPLEENRRGIESLSEIPRIVENEAENALLDTVEQSDRGNSERFICKASINGTLADPEYLNLDNIIDKITRAIDECDDKDTVEEKLMHLGEIKGEWFIKMEREEEGTPHYHIMESVYVPLSECILEAVAKIEEDEIDV